MDPKKSTETEQALRRNTAIEENKELFLGILDLVEKTDRKINELLKLLRRTESLSNNLKVKASHLREGLVLTTFPLEEQVRREIKHLEEDSIFFEPFTVENSYDLKTSLGDEHIILVANVQYALKLLEIETVQDNT